MTDILVRPPELRQISEQLRSCAQKIGIALQAIDGNILLLKGDKFLGNRADMVQSHYVPKRDALLKAKNIVSHFADDLQRAATVFESADRGQFTSLFPSSAGSIWGGSVISIFLPGFIANLFRTITPWKSLKLPQWLTEKLDGVFKPAEIITPLAKELLAPETEQPLTGFGKLLQQTPDSALTESATSSQPDPVPDNDDQSKLNVSYAVPIKAQEAIYGNAGCSPTSVSMILDYYNAQDPQNKTISPQELVDSMDEGDGTVGKGISLSRLTDELNDLGYENISQQVGAEFSDLDNALKGGPVIVTAGVRIVGPGTISADVPRAIEGPGNTIHAMVVTGIGDNLVSVNDPWSGQNLQFSLETFEKMWTRGSSAIYSIRP